MTWSHLASSRRTLLGNPASVRKMLPGSLLAAYVAAAFLMFFQFTKHDPTLSAILPFGDDPYDAVGSFGVIIAGLLAVLAVVRAVQVPTRRRKGLVARTQAAITAAVAVTLGADVVAMARHVPMWFGRPGALELIALMLVLLALAVLLWFAARRSVRESPVQPTRWRRAVVVCAIAVAVLVVYPESLTSNAVGELFTILAGIVLLFVPMSALLEVLVPVDGDSAESGEVRGLRIRASIQWLAVALVGIGIGVALLVGELMGRDAPAPALRVMLASVYIGAALAGLAIGYYALRRPLALFEF
jgi:hypothetical protein